MPPGSQGFWPLCGPRLGGALVAQDSVDAFIVSYTMATGPEASLRSVPSSLSVDALSGAIDLAATLAVGRPVHAKGLLENPSAIAGAPRRTTGCGLHIADGPGVGPG